MMCRCHMIMATITATAAGPRECVQFWRARRSRSGAGCSCSCRSLPIAKAPESKQRIRASTQYLQRFAFDVLLKIITAPFNSHHVVQSVIDPGCYAYGGRP